MTTSIGDADAVRSPPVRWLPAVNPRAVARDDPHGWYQHALAVAKASVAKDVLRLVDCHLSPSERDATRALAPDPLDPLVRSAPDADVVSAMTWSVLAQPDQKVVTHAGILYRVIRVGDVAVPVGGLSGVRTLPDARGRGYARAVVASAAAFVGVWLWAPFALVLCSLECTAFYRALGWHATTASTWYERPGGQRQQVLNRVGMVLPCQGEADWPSGPIDLCGPAW